jgi:hypothetical protein
VVRCWLFNSPITAMSRDDGDYGDLFQISAISENQW